MLCLSGFELYSRWVPLSDGRRQGKCTKKGDAIVLFCLFKPFPFLSVSLWLAWDPFALALRKGKDRDVGAQENRGGGVRKANEERAGSGSSNRVGSGRNRGKLHNSA